jgi:hypothetical protein
MARLTNEQFAKRKNKVAQRAELVERGLWDAFVKRREALKASGLDAPEAWARAFEEVTSGSIPDSVGVAEVAPVQSGAPDNPHPKDQVADGRVSEEVFGERTCSITKTVEWVAKQLMVDDPKADHAPSPEAWSMLCWARRSNQNEAQFWGQIWSKMMPSKQQLDAAERLSDDGAAVLELIDRVRNISEGIRSAAQAPDS